MRAAAEPDSALRKRVAATVLITDPADRVLVVNPTYKPRWELPGGAVEADESPAAGARREIVEELGVALEVGRLLALDYVPATDARTEGLIVVFDGGQLAGLDDITLPPDELSDAAFVDPDTLEAYLLTAAGLPSVRRWPRDDVGGALYAERLTEDAGQG